MLFLMAAGLTLVFGIMNLVNLAHGSLYMVGAYVATAAFTRTGSFLAAVVIALAATLAVGMLVEVIALRSLYERDHLDQVLATFGLILFFNEAVAIVWGRAALFTTVPRALSGHIQILPRPSGSSAWNQTGPVRRTTSSSMKKSGAPTSRPSGAGCAPRSANGSSPTTAAASMSASPNRPLDQADQPA